ncbi:MAG: hypothetical protein RMI91_14245, partial [Gemmatales bacterium]|nr:hypothetical protein [Gemmatales bacterium]
LPAEGYYFEPFDYFLTEIRKMPIGTVNRLYEQIREALLHPWQVPQYPLVADWLRYYEPLLNRTAHLIDRPRFYRPVSGIREDLGSEPLPELFTTLMLVRAYLSRAMLHAGHGFYQLAWEDIFTALRIGRTFEKGTNPFDRLYGALYNAVACGTLGVYLTHAPNDAQTWLKYLEQLEKLPTEFHLADAVHIYDRAVALQRIQLIHRRGTFASSFEEAQLPVPDDRELALLRRELDWNEALCTCNRILDEIVAAWERQNFQERQKELKRVEAKYKPLANMIEPFSWEQVIERLQQGQRQEMARMLGAKVCLGLMGLQERTLSVAHRSRQIERLVQMGMALAAFRDDNGRFPDQLQELVPKYRPRLEADLFSGQPLIYRRTDTGYVLYSVGPNGRDDEARTSRSNPQGDDIVLRIPYVWE